MIGLGARLPDPARTALRTVVADVNRAISGLPAAGAGLVAAWNELLELLALGPEPEYRQCPGCGAVGMRDATVCGYCWAKLPRLEEGC